MFFLRFITDASIIFDIIIWLVGWFSAPFRHLYISTEEVNNCIVLYVYLMYNKITVIGVMSQWIETMVTSVWEFILWRSNIRDLYEACSHFIFICYLLYVSISFICRIMIKYIYEGRWNYKIYLSLPLSACVLMFKIFSNLLRPPSYVFCCILLIHWLIDYLLHYSIIWLYILYL